MTKQRDVAAIEAAAKSLREATGDVVIAGLMATEDGSFSVLINGEGFVTAEQNAVMMAFKKMLLKLAADLGPPSQKHQRSGPNHGMKMRVQ
jgi:hypothetical protein